MSKSNRPSRVPLVGLWGSAGLSIGGNTMVEVLIPWLVLRQTGSATYAGLIGGAALGAAVVAMFGAGALVDRWDRRATSVGADLLSGAAVAAIPIVDHLGGLSLTAIAVLVAVGALFDGPGAAAREALRPPVARATRTRLDKVASYGEVTDAIGEVAGPAAAGLLVAAVGLSTSFWVATGVFIAAAGVVWVLVPRFPAESETRPYLAATVAGFSYIWRDRVLRDTGAMLALFGFFISPIVLVLTSEFERGDKAAALGLVVAAFAVGAIAGALVFASLSERLPRRPTLLVSFGFVSAGIAVMAPALGSVAALTAVAVATGFAAGPINPILSVVMLDRSADEYRGRVISTLTALWLVAGFVSFMLAGVFISLTSEAVVLAVMGLGSLAVTFVAAAVPGLRHIETADLVR